MKKLIYIALYLVVVFLGWYFNEKKSSPQKGSIELSSKAKAEKLITTLLTHPHNFEEYSAIKNMRNEVEITARTKDAIEVIYRKGSTHEWLQINTPDLKIVDKSASGRVTMATHIRDKGRSQGEIQEKFKKDEDLWQQEYEKLLTETLQ